MVSSSSEIPFSQAIILIFTLYMPIHSFSMGLSISDEGRVFRAPDKIENSLFIPFGGMYLLYIIFVLNKIQSLLTLFIPSLKIVDPLNYAMQGVFRQFNLEVFLTDKIFGFMPPQSLIPNTQNIILSLCIFYLIFIFLAPFYAGKFANDVSFNRDFLTESFDSVSGYFHGVRKLNVSKDYQAKLFFRFTKDNLFKILLFTVGLPFTILILVFFILKEIGGLKTFLKFFSSESIPETLEAVYNPDKTVVVDLALSDRKMITGILSNIMTNKRDESMNCFLLEHPFKRERFEKTSFVIQNKVLPPADSVGISNFFIHKKFRSQGDAIKIPCKSFYVPYSSVKEMNIYVVPHDIYIFIYGICDINNIADVYDKIMERLQSHHTTKYIFSDIQIFYNGNIESLIGPIFVQNKIEFKRIRYRDASNDIIDFFRVAVVEREGNIAIIEL